MQHAAQKLGVRYVLEGSVRRSPAQVRIGAQLVDANTRAQLWTARFDRPLADLFDVQDDIAARVASAIEPAIRKGEIEQARRTRPGSLTAYDLYLRALPHLYAMRPDDNAVARRFLEQALEIDPAFAAAQACLAWGHERRGPRGPAACHGPQSEPRADRQSRRNGEPVRG